MKESIETKKKQPGDILWPTRKVKKGDKHSVMGIRDSIVLLHNAIALCFPCRWRDMEGGLFREERKRRSERSNP